MTRAHGRPMSVMYDRQTDIQTIVCNTAAHSTLPRPQSPSTALQLLSGSLERVFLSSEEAKGRGKKAARKDREVCLPISLILPLPPARTALGLLALYNFPRHPPALSQQICHGPPDPAPTICLPSQPVCYSLHTRRGLPFNNHNSDTIQFGTMLPKYRLSMLHSSLQLR
jgi:hypothetical protein